MALNDGTSFTAMAGHNPFVGLVMDKGSTTCGSALCSDGFLAHVRKK